MIPRAGLALVLLAGGVAAASEVELRHGEDRLSRELPRWRETALRMAWSRPGGPGVAVTPARVERFDLVDWTVAAAAHAPVGRGWDVGVEGSFSPTHDVLPAWGAGARASRALGRGLVAGGGLRWARYEAGEVSTGVAVGDLGLEYYRGPFRLAWTSFAARLDGAWGLSHAAAGDLYYRTRDRAGVVLSAGRELESLGAGRVLVTDVLGAALHGRTAVSRAWAVTYGVEVQRQGDLYTRAGGRLGLAREF